MTAQLELAIEPCLWCSRPHEYLCDSRLRGDHHQPVTCDARMCETHATRVGHGHMCARGRAGSCEAFDIHQCPYCKDQVEPIAHAVQAEQHRAIARAHGRR